MRTAVVTGASSGVGLAVAQHLSLRMHVAVLARRSERLSILFEGVPNVSIHPCDIGDRSAFSAVLQSIAMKYGAIDTLVNNAGIMVKGSVVALGSIDVERSFSVNVLAPLCAMQAVLPSMRERNFGRVINVTSGAAFNCSPDHAAYSLTKAALNALTMTAAREYSGSNVKINLMSPGPVRSEMAPNAPMDAAVCLPTVDYLVDLEADGPTGQFFWMGRELPTVPDLSGVEWLEGKASDRFPTIRSSGS